MRVSFLRFLVLAGLILGWSAPPAAAHAILLSTSPQANSTVDGRGVRLKLQYNSRIDGKRSRVLLVFPGDRERVIECDQTSPDILTSDLKDLAPGEYILRWQVLAEDGHITRGELSFRVQ